MSSRRDDPSRRDNLIRLFTAMHQYPALAKHIKSDPQHIASLFGFQLSEHEAEAIRSRLDVDIVLKSATGPESMAVKALEAIGIEKRSEEAD
jgi:hypothetical protein